MIDFESMRNTLLDSINDAGESMPKLISWEIQQATDSHLNLVYRVKKKEENIQIHFQRISEHDDLLFSPHLETTPSQRKLNSFIFSNLRYVYFSFASFMSGMWFSERNISSPEQIRASSVLISSDITAKANERIVENASHTVIENNSKNDKKISGFLVLSTWMLIFGHQTLTYILNKNLLRITNEIGTAVENGQLSLANIKLESKLIKFSLHYAPYMLIDVNQEISARLWYYMGRVSESQRTYNKAIESYRTAYRLAVSNETRFSIIKHLYERLSQDSCVNATEMKELINSLPRHSACFQSEWTKLFLQIENVQKLLLNNKIKEAYDTFNRILPANAFMQKTYPRLFARYCQLQVALILIGQIEPIDRISNFDRTSLAICILEKGVTAISTIAAEHGSLLRSTLAQLRILLPDSSAKLSETGMYGTRGGNSSSITGEFVGYQLDSK